MSEELSYDPIGFDPRFLIAAILKEAGGEVVITKEQLTSGFGYIELRELEDGLFAIRLVEEEL